MNRTRLRIEHLEDRAVPTVLPAGFSESVFASGLTRATNMAAVPDGRIFVTEQTGAVRVIENGTVLSTPLLTVNVESTRERGLGAITLDPNFKSNGFVYVFYTVPGADLAAAHNRVSRFTVEGNVADPASERVLLDNLGPPLALNHMGGALRFGPDGKLYIATGDNSNQDNAQLLTNRFGKILRINPDGTIPADNPTTFDGIVGTTTGANRAIWAVGLRNPYSFAFQPGTGLMFINDVGSVEPGPTGGGTFEEINVGRAGANYGWPLTEGPNQPGVPGVTYPLYAYGRTGDPLFTGNAIVGGVFYNPVNLAFPADYVGDYFFTDLGGGWINLLDPETGTVTNFASELTGNAVVALDRTPGGDLLYLSRLTGSIYRITFSSPGAAIAVGPGAGGGPVAELTDPVTGIPKVSVTAFGETFRGGVRVASADVTGDRVPDLIVGAGPGAAPHVQVFDGNTGQMVRSFFALDPSFAGGVFVAAADFDRDGFADIVVSPDTGGGPRVQVFSGEDLSVLANFFGIDDTGFRGGARVAAGDMNGDGVPELVVAAGKGGGPRVAVFDGQSIGPGRTPAKLFKDFFAFEPVLRDGVYVAVGDMNGDGTGDLVVGAGPGGAPRVVAFSGLLLQAGPEGALVASFFAGDQNARNGVPVAAQNLDASAAAEIITGTAAGPTSGAAPRVSIFSAADGTATLVREFLTFDPAFTGGVFVG